MLDKLSGHAFDPADPKLLRSAAIRRVVEEMSPVEIEDALWFTDMLQWAGGMSASEAAGWRWCLLARWVEIQSADRAETASSVTQPARRSTPEPSPG